MGNHICTGQQDNHPPESNERRRLSKHSQYDDMLQSPENIFEQARMSFTSLSSKSGKKSNKEQYNVRLTNDFLKQFPIQVQVPKTVFKTIQNLKDMIILQIIPEYYQFDIVNNDKILDLSENLVNYADNNENNFMQFSIRLKYKEGQKLKDKTYKIDYISVQSFSEYDQNKCSLPNFYFDIAKSIVSLLNKKGGKILVGVNPDSSYVEGINQINDIEQQLSELKIYLNDHIHPCVQDLLIIIPYQFPYDETQYLIEIQIDVWQQSTRQLFSLDYICYFKLKNTQITILEPEQYIELENKFHKKSKVQISKE